MAQGVDPGIAELHERLDDLQQRLQEATDAEAQLTGDIEELEGEKYELGQALDRAERLLIGAAKEGALQAGVVSVEQISPLVQRVTLDIAATPGDAIWWHRGTRMFVTGTDLDGLAKLQKFVRTEL